MRDSIQQNSSAFMMIPEKLFLIIIHSLPCQLYATCIYWMFVTIHQQIPKITIKTKKVTFQFIFPVFEVFTIKYRRSCVAIVTVVTIVLLSRARCRCRFISSISHLLLKRFSLPESFLNTVKCLHLRTGALMPIEG